MPDRPQNVIVNTTPIIALTLIDSLPLLRHLYGEVHVPPAVNAELLAGGARNVGAAEIEASPWFRVTPLEDSRRADLLSDLDRGEAEVIALAQELESELVIIDERLARRHAGRLGLTLTGTLGVLLKAKENGLVPAIAPLIQTLQQNGIRLGEAVIAETLRLAGEG